MKKLIFVITMLFISLATFSQNGFSIVEKDTIELNFVCFNIEGLNNKDGLIDYNGEVKLYRNKDLTWNVEYKLDGIGDYTVFETNSEICTSRWDNEINNYAVISLNKKLCEPYYKKHDGENVKVFEYKLVRIIYDNIRNGYRLVIVNDNYYWPEDYEYDFVYPNNYEEYKIDIENI